MNTHTHTHNMKKNTDDAERRGTTEPYNIHDGNQRVFSHGRLEAGAAAAGRDEEGVPVEVIGELCSSRRPAKQKW